MAISAFLWDHVVLIPVIEVADPKHSCCCCSPRCRCRQLSDALGVTPLAMVGALVRLPPSPLFEFLGLRPTSLAVRFAQLRDLLQVRLYRKGG